MTCVAVIRGSAALPLSGADAAEARDLSTPWGDPSGEIVEFNSGTTKVLLLNRHGAGHRHTAHQVNYRANVWALRELGAQAIVATFTVGGIRASLEPGALLLADQVVDYTWGRAQTFDLPEARHVEFSEPFDADLSGWLQRGAQQASIPLAEPGTYGCTQGPRLETAAEIDRLDRDGCAVVGMTAMPEAVLARELGLPYAGLCLVVNPAAGRGAIAHGDIAAVGERGMRAAARLVDAALELGVEGLESGD